MVVSMSLNQCLVAASLHLRWEGICDVTYADPVAHVRRRARRPFIWQRPTGTRTWWTCCWTLELKLMHQARSACPCSGLLHAVAPVSNGGVTDSA
jgi:hypothetical protein